MSLKHGNRIRFQVLLESFRGQLLIDLAEERGMRATALVREIVYEYLAKNLDEDRYTDALRKDVQMWNESVEARVAGRGLERHRKVRRPITLDDLIDHS